MAKCQVNHRCYMVTKACMEIPIYAFNLALCHIWIKLMKHKFPLHKISNIPKDSIRLINFRDNETFTKMGRFQNFLEFFLVIHEGIIWSKKIWKTEFSLSPPVSPLWGGGHRGLTGGLSENLFSISF